jgi:hypothetical protein
MRRGEERASGLLSMVTSNRSMFSAECQAEKRDLVTGISLLYEFEPKTLNESFQWKAWKQTENRNKTLQKEVYDCNILTKNLMRSIRTPCKLKRRLPQNAPMRLTGVII